jgi:hypothetical protein
LARSARLMDEQISMGLKETARAELQDAPVHVITTMALTEPPFSCEATSERVTAPERGISNHKLVVQGAQKRHAAALRA